MFQWIVDRPLFIAIALVNLVLFAMMGVDKARAKKKRRRIRERTLMLFAVFFGAIGGCLGMYLFRHKTLHKKFSIGFPLLAVIQVVLYFIFFTPIGRHVPFLSGSFKALL